MNFLNKLFLVGLVVVSGSILAGCKPCRAKRTAPAAAVLVKKAAKRRTTRVARKATPALRVSKNASTDKAKSGNKAKSAALAAYFHKRKGGCKNGVCSL